MATSKSNHIADAPKRVFILGGGYAGITAARRLAHHTKGQPVEITLINGSDQFVERIRLHQTAVAQKIRHFTISQMLKGFPVQFVQGWVTKIDPAAQTVTVKDKANVRMLNYDYMIYALGSAINLSNVAGAAENALSVTQYQSAVELQHKLVALSKTSKISGPNGQVVVVGGGLTGIEMATEVAEQFPQLRVTLMAREPFMVSLSAYARTYTRRVFDKLKIQVIDQAEVTQVNPDSVNYTANGEPGLKRLPADVVIWAASFAVPTLARDSGLSVNARGQVLVDERLRSVSYPNIYAAGDSASPDEAIHQVVDMGCKTAMPMGAYTADDLAARLAGRTAEPFDYGYVIYCISLGRRQGLIQFYKPNGEVRNSALTGWLGAKVKEMICQFTILQMHYIGTFYYTRRPAAYRTGKYSQQAQQAASTPLPDGAR